MSLQIDQLLQNVPINQREDAKKAIPFIIEALDKEGILTPKTLSYAIATVGHESSFVPKEEVMANRGVNQRNDYIAGLQDNYQGGKKYRGRGYIQLTHQGNYDKFGKRIGEDLVKNPERAKDPEVAAKVLAAYFKDNGVSQAVEVNDYDTARVRVQGRGALNPQFIGNTKSIEQMAKTIPSDDFIKNRQLEKDQPDFSLKQIQDNLFSSPEANPSAQFVPTPQKQLTEPIAFKPMPQVQIPEPLRLQKEDVNLPAPAFDVGLKPNIATTSAQPFTPGFTQPVANVTKTFADIVRQNFIKDQALPQTPQQAQQQQQQQVQLKPQQPPKIFGVPKPKPKQQTISAGVTGIGRSQSNSGARMASPSVRIATPRSYTVKRGDTLSSIAQRRFGNANRWRELGYSGDPRKLQIGTRL